MPVHGDPVTEHGGGSLTGDSERDNKRYIKIDVKMPCKQVSLSLGAPLGNLEGIHLLGLLEKNGLYIRIPFLDPEDIKILSHLEL
jgi:hypothetical protein